MGRVVARDSDAGELGRVTYSLAVTSSPLFEMERETGKIFLAAPRRHEDLPLGREHHLVAVASDGGGRNASVRVHVILPSRNDNPPRFVRAVGVEYRVAGAASRRIAELEAEDDDEGDEVTYSLSESSLFDVDSRTGLVTAKRNLTEVRRILSTCCVSCFYSLALQVVSITYFSSGQQTMPL